LQSALAKRYQQLQQTQPYEYNVQAMGMRSLKNLCLYYLQILEDQSFQAQALSQLHQADNMTDKMGALQALNDHQSEAREMALAEFYQAWQHEPLVVDKWLSLQASANLPDTLQRVKSLVDHPAFDIRNPNKVRALIGVFANNLFYFHALDGSGYVFLAEQVLAIDPANPQLAARILEPLSRWQYLDHERQQLMKHQLQRIMQTKNLSKDVYEVTAKSLAV
jgi:aminopeptidase N